MHISPARLLWAALLFWPVQAMAGEKLVIGVESVYYLPLAAYENGVYRGYARDVFDAFAKDRGYDVEYRALPVPRLYASFFEGEVDFKFPDNARWKQDQRAGKKIHYSDPVAAYIDGTSVTPDKKNSAAPPIKRLGTMGGFTPWAWMERIGGERIQLSENTQLEALVRQALTGRVDAVYASVAVVNYQLDHVLKQPGALVFNPALPYSRDNYHLSTLKRPEILNEFNDWMRKNRQRIAALKKKYGVEKGVTAN
jgi:ABC-type amino acid transport substrate-binding protein